jgi:hypothetical protein
MRAMLITVTVTTQTMVQGTDAVAPRDSKATLTLRMAAKVVILLGLIIVDFLLLMDFFFNIYFYVFFFFQILMSAKIPPSASKYAPIYLVLINVPVSQDMRAMANGKERAANSYKGLRGFL